MIFSFLLLFFLNYLLKIYKQKKPYSIVFNAGIILSLLSFYIPHTLMLYPLIILSTLVFRNIDWRVILISLLSLLVPYLFVWTYQFFFQQKLLFPTFNFNYISINFEFKTPITFFFLITSKLASLLFGIGKDSARQLNENIINKM